MKQETLEAVRTFRDERNWQRFHTAKDLAISISLEASELLELFQWVDSDEAVAHDKDEMADELADVLIYLVQFADLLGLDLDAVVMDKLRKNAEKYPVDAVRTCRDKYDLSPCPQSKGR